MSRLTPDVTVLLGLLVGCAPAAAAASTGDPAGQFHAPFHWASESDAVSMDPYTRNELQQLALTGNIYEPLVRRGVDGRLEPALAERWEQTSPEEWTFHLRAGVLWQDGRAFTADDVLFSFERVRSDTSLLKSVVASVASARQTDDLTVVLRTSAPDPLLPQELPIWYIMSRAWSEAHGASQPTLLSGGAENYATRHAMGTGAYGLGDREPDEHTVFEANVGWWGRPTDAPARAQFEVLPDDATRVAALLAGDVDMITAVPPLDAERVAATPGLRLQRGAELRTIFLGMDQSRAVLMKSDVKNRNPFRDVRVREAVGLAIDEEAIAAKIMRGQARPSWLLWAPGVTGYDAALDRRPAVDPARARALLAEAGLPDGFAVTLDCPSDRYVMDDAICTALVPMLARAGIRLVLNVQPKARFFAEVGPPSFQTSFYMLGWAPPTYDAENVIKNLAETRSGSRGAINFGGFSDPGLDSLSLRISGEPDPTRRLALIDEAARLLQAQHAYVPLHQQMLLWGMRDGIEMAQPPDGMLRLRLVRAR